MEPMQSRKRHLRGVGAGSELVREGLGQNPIRASCESKKGMTPGFMKSEG